MSDILNLIKRLPDRHQVALLWFHELAGKVQPWPEALPDGSFLVTKAKGIYKPEWSEYALSVREVLKGPYRDHAPERRPDGTWQYRYYQEGQSPAARDDFYTNRGLIACMRDAVPVGVLRQLQPKPDVRYEILGLALVTAWKAGYFYLEGAATSGVINVP